MVSICCPKGKDTSWYELSIFHIWEYASVVEVQGGLNWNCAFEGSAREPNKAQRRINFFMLQFFTGKYNVILDSLRKEFREAEAEEK